MTQPTLADLALATDDLDEAEESGTSDRSVAEMTQPTTLTTTQLQWCCAYYKDKDGNFLLEGVREPCASHPICRAATHEPEECPDGWDCITCYGLGWRPTKDAWKWLTQLAFIVTPDLDGVSRDFLLAILDTPQAYYYALSEALRPLAINAAEAETCVLDNLTPCCPECVQEVTNG